MVRTLDTMAFPETLAPQTRGTFVWVLSAGNRTMAVRVSQGFVAGTIHCSCV